MSEYKITGDLFTVPGITDDYILYAPRVGFACRANGGLVNLLGNLDKIDPNQLTVPQIDTLKFLEKKGIVNGTWEYTVNGKMPGQYKPTQVTLFPTNNCNLRCTYCYASAGDFQVRDIDFFIAEKAVEAVIKNVKDIGKCIRKAMQ